MTSPSSPDEQPTELGKADWLYQRTDPSEDFVAGMHIPCCSMLVVTRNSDNEPIRVHTCHNGPLVGDQIVSGDCGEHERSVAAWLH